MKYSVYNTYLNISPHVGCIYNALTDKTVVFYGDAKKLKSHDCLPFSLKDKFVESGILIEENKDEFSQYIELAKKVENDETIFHLLINPTLNCNFHCNYCYESHFNSKMDDGTLAKVKKLITRQFEKGRNLTISFFGGEPLLYYDNIMKPLIEFALEKAELYSKAFNCNMTSNGFLLNEERVKWLSEHRFTNTQITLDGSKEIHNTIRYRHPGDNTFDRIVENIKLLVRHGISVTLRLNSTNQNIESFNEIPNTFEDLSESEKKLIIPSF